MWPFLTRPARSKAVRFAKVRPNLRCWFTLGGLHPFCCTPTVTHPITEKASGSASAQLTGNRRDAETRKNTFWLQTTPSTFRKFMAARKSSKVPLPKTAPPLPNCISFFQWYHDAVCQRVRKTPSDNLLHRVIYTWYLLYGPTVVYKFVHYLSI